MHVPPKIGPLPTWAWGLVLIGGLGLGLYLRRRSSGSPTASVVSGGGPVPTLGAAGGGSDGGGTSGVSTGMDPILAGLLSDSNNALVSESGIFAGIAAQSVQAALDASGSVLGVGQDLIGKATLAYTSQTPIYVIGSSPAGASPAGTTAPYATPTLPPAAPYAPPAPVLARVSTAGVASPSGQASALVDASGHVVNAKGARVGGRTLDS